MIRGKLVGDNLLVELKSQETESKSSAGIILQEEQAPAINTGEIVMISDGAMVELEGAALGAIVSFSAYCGYRYSRGGKSYALIQFDDVFSVES